MLDSLFDSFDNIIVFDVETTGFDAAREEIIELAALRAVRRPGKIEVAESFDLLVRLPDGKHLEPVIVRLTGIQETDLQKGVSREEVCGRMEAMLKSPRPLLVAYNAQFDLSFLYRLLQRFGDAELLRRSSMLDALTVYRDRRPYPHKLSDAVQAYSLKTRNTHRAVDDARATLELLCEMGSERDDLLNYVNLFGFNPKYGVSGPRISSVRYVPQLNYCPHKIYEE